VTDGRPITERQDDPEHRRRLLAYSRDYDLAGRWHRLQVASAGLLAAVPLVLAAMDRDAPAWFGALAGAYLVFARTLLRTAERRVRERAALVQEVYDTRLFRLPWNTALAGEPAATADTEASAEAFLRSKRYAKDPGRYDRWYDVDVAGLAWPQDVLACQYESSAWSRRDHTAYSRVLWWAFGGLLALLVVTGLLRHLELSDFLVLLFLPAAPAALDVSERALTHGGQATGRRRIERAICISG